MISPLPISSTANCNDRNICRPETPASRKGQTGQKKNVPLGGDSHDGNQNIVGTDFSVDHYRMGRYNPHKKTASQTNIIPNVDGNNLKKKSKIEQMLSFLDKGTSYNHHYEVLGYKKFINTYCNGFTENLNEIKKNLDYEYRDGEGQAEGIATNQLKELIIACKDKLSKFDSGIETIESDHKKYESIKELNDRWKEIKKLKNQCQNSYNLNKSLLKNREEDTFNHFETEIRIRFENCDMNEYIEIYKEKIKKLKKQEEARCNTDINEPEGCIKELNDFLKPLKGEGDTLLYKCGHYPETKKSCCSNLDQEDCEHKKFFNTYLKKYKKSSSM